MKNFLLTTVITKIINKYILSEDYGVSLFNIPEFDYSEFTKKVSTKKKIELYFLGFDKEKENEINKSIVQTSTLSVNFSIEEAEQSRNSGDENIFRILIIQRSELEKLSSLKWIPKISLEDVYIESCDYIKQNINASNSVLPALIQALRSKQIRNILNFERVLDYFNTLLEASNEELPQTIRSNYYKLGLCSDAKFDEGNPSKDDFINKIKRNHNIVETISNLEQKQRQGITNYYSKQDVDKNVPEYILKYYNDKNIEYLATLDIDKVEECLKAAKQVNGKPPKPPKAKQPVLTPTAAAAQIIFDDDTEAVEDVLNQIATIIDDKPSSTKPELVEIDLDDTKIKFKTTPVTEKFTEDEAVISENNFGGVIKADVQAPDEAIRDSDKYEYNPLKQGYLDAVFDNLATLSTMITNGEEITISKRLSDFLAARKEILPYKKRLQDAPMLQVIAQHQKFSNYISCYEKLLQAIDEDFKKIWHYAPTKAKEIINIIISLDYLFILGDTRSHAIPTPLNPLYLWKYVELAKEILSSKGVSAIDDESALDENDKNFIVRKAEDIPDPLTVALLPATINKEPAFLPLAGRLGSLPVYSNTPQINQSESGLETLSKSIIRYLCLYPHAGMMLKLCVIDPPSVEEIVSMLKNLSNSKEFNILGIEITIYRTKEVPLDWIEIDDDSLNDGMLGKVKGKHDLNFKFHIINKKYSYNDILDKINQMQHLCIIFDPNEVKVDTAQNEKNIHIHPLCIPKIYKYDPLENTVSIRPSNEGGIFSVYSKIIEKLNEHPSSFSHTSVFFNTPLKKDTYDKFLKNADWLIILDQSLKTWDVSLSAASEKLFYQENDYRSVGIYSRNCKKFVLGYNILIASMGNFVPNEEGTKNIIESIRSVNNDGLLSIVSHTSNRIFDTKHGQGSLGLALAAQHFKKNDEHSFMVGLDTQLAKEWLSDREDGKLPDLIKVKLTDSNEAQIELIEVKTYSNNEQSFKIIDDSKIEGHAVEQVSILENLIKEMFCGTEEKITTVSRKEILREQIFETLFQSNIEPRDKRNYTDLLNALFAGDFKVTIKKNIAFVDFENRESFTKEYSGTKEYEGSKYFLTKIGSDEIQALLSGKEVVDNVITVERNENLTIRTENNCVDETSPENKTYSTTVVTSNENERTIDSSEKNKSVENLNRAVDKMELEKKCQKLNKVFRDYDIKAQPLDISMVQEAARFTRFKVELKSGETIKNLEKRRQDIAIQLEANGEILINHIKGTKFISVDVPFADSAKAINLIDYLHLLNDPECKGALSFVAGQKPDGNFKFFDLATAPHLLVSGTTGSGKTIFLYSIIESLLYKYPIDSLEFLIIDPKRTDFVFFEDLPNLYGGHIVTDAEEALAMLQKINEVDKEERTDLITKARSRDIASYNEKNPNNKMKRLIVIIDEYADIIQTAEMQGNRKEFEKNLSMLAQKVRSLGIHLIIATQRPSANIVTGVLKANIPCRVSFRLPSHTDSQTILDMPGAENLLGKGDMLMVTESDVERLQALFITEDQLEKSIKKIIQK